MLRRRQAFGGGGLKSGQFLFQGFDAEVLVGQHAFVYGQRLGVLGELCFRLLRFGGQRSDFPFSSRPGLG